MSPFSQGMDTSQDFRYDSGRSSYGSSFDSGYGSSGYDSYGGNYGSSYGGGSSYGRRGRYGGGFDTRGSQTRRGGYGARRGGEGLNLSLGYIYNTGQRLTAIPDVNSAPSRLQAMVLSGNWGDRFNLRP